MLKSQSPLRYPGGKSCLYGLLAELLRANRLKLPHYVEPYAGGCGLALALLFGGHVSDIHINDVDPGIWAFWWSVLHDSKALVDLLQSTDVSVDEWNRQREVNRIADTSKTLELGFSTFFLNRTNRSGVIKGAGVIGGIQQLGLYKIDCRFNKQELARRIERIARYRNRIHLTNLDALPFMKGADSTLPDSTFFCIDPPYFNKGSKLYTNFYGPEEHAKVADAVLRLRRGWIATYDDTPEIRRLYSSQRQFQFDIKYSVQTKRMGTELLIASCDLVLPASLQARMLTCPALADGVIAA